MASSTPCISLLVPGMARKLADSGASPILHWQGGATLQPWQSRLCDKLALSQWSGQHLPAAELLAGRFGDHVEEHDAAGRAPLVCADPVCLNPGRDSATLIPAASLGLQVEEADALLESINAFLQADGLYLCRSGIGQWILQGRDGSALRSYPTTFMAWRSATAFLPEGESVGEWQRLSTEIQMLLHQHPVNAARQGRGEHPVNSLWFWGGARLASAPTAQGRVATPHWRIHADDPFVVSLSRYLQIPCHSLRQFDPHECDAPVLVVDTALEQAMLSRDEAAVIESRHRLLNEWPAIWQRRLEQGEDLVVEWIDEEGNLARLDRGVLQDHRTGRHASENGIADGSRQGDLVLAALFRRVRHAMKRCWCGRWLR